MRFEEEKNYSKEIMDALKSGDEKAVNEAMQKIHEALTESIKNGYLDAKNDREVLAQSLKTS